MQDTLDGVFIEHARNIVRIAEIAFTGRNSFCKRSVSGREVIEDDWLKSRAFQRFDSVASNVSGAAGDKNHDRHILEQSHRRHSRRIP
jgi:hypothetical protein